MPKRANHAASPPRIARVREFFHARGANHIDYYAAPSDKFKSVTLRFTLHAMLTPEHAPAGALLSSLLRRGTKSHPTMAALSAYCEDLYGTSITCDASRLGARQLLSLTVRFPGPAYVSNGEQVFKKAVDLIREMVCEPLTENGGFVPAIFASEKTQLLHSIDALKDDKASYAMRRALEVSFAGRPDGLPEYGSEEGVRALDPKTAYAHFIRLLATAPMDVHIAGPVTVKRHLPAVMATFANLKRTQPVPLPHNTTAPTPKSARKAMEKTQGEQAFVVLTHATGVGVGDPAFQALLLADAIFGRLPTSRLFRVVREEHGLAYSVSSTISPTSGLSFAWAGADPANAEKARKLILKQLAVLAKEGFRADEFEAARNSLIEDFLSVQDSPGAGIGSLLMQQSCGVVVAPQRALSRLRAVTPAQVRAVLRRYRPCAEFRLLPT